MTETTEAEKALNIVYRAISEKLASLMDALARGDSKSFEEYKSLCGEIRGLRYAEQEVLDLANTIRNAQ